MSLRDLPALNALLNTTSAVLLVTGWLLIRAKRIRAHRRVMTTALVSSALFLAGYLTYHAQVGSVRFLGTGTARTVYLTVLASHTLLAMVVAPLALTVFVLGRRDSREKHRRLARWTLPLWLYVSVTGVVIYVMLYQLYPNSLGG